MSKFDLADFVHVAKQEYGLGELERVLTAIPTVELKPTTYALSIPFTLVRAVISQLP